MNHIIEHCGNFSPEVLEGLIGYGRETNKGRGKRKAANKLPSGDGYATREADILLGGFIQQQAAQRVFQEGQSLARLDVSRVERVACQIAREHLERHGTANREHYAHWMIRTRAFAKRHQIVLPSRMGKETDHQYYRRVRQWIKGRDESHPSHPSQGGPSSGHGDSAHKWPELRSAAGTHLVFSPDPKVWESIRGMGLDERLFLKSVLIQTMKEFADWRRKEVGTGHGLGWVAGTHVRENGADRHPHVHLVVLKRDEAGKEVDWSVSCLKGRQGRADADPMRELKRVFEKNVEKHLERMVGKENMPEKAGEPKKETVRQFLHRQNHLSSEGQALVQIMQTLHRVMRGYGMFPPGNDMSDPGGLLRSMALMARAVAMIREARKQQKDFYPPLVKKVMEQVRASHHRRQKDISEEMER